MIKRLLSILFLISTTLAVAQWTNGPNANLVLGQLNYTSALANQGGTPTSLTINAPQAVCIDSVTGKVFVADAGNNRVLRYANIQNLINGNSAEGVLGQPDFVTVSSGTTSTKMYSPSGVVLDKKGNLYVADAANYRVLRFAVAVTKANGAAAEGVFGQTTMTSSVSATTQTNFAGTPRGLAIDTDGRLYVADFSGNRILQFASPSTVALGVAANKVFGQTDFITNVAGTTQSKLYGPMGVCVDVKGNLYVGDFNNNRVLRFNAIALKATGASADGVIGQTDFTTNINGTSASKLFNPYYLSTDINNTLYVSDFSNNRVAVYYFADGKTNGAAADAVIGQINFVVNPNFTSQSGMYRPTGVIAYDFPPKVIVADQGNNRLLRYASVPTISSFAPSTGAVGTSVTITGVNFSITAENNIVFFGAVKAAVTSATSTQLTVTVPAGATYQPISVMVNGLIAYSTKPFGITFPTGSSITTSTLSAKVDFASGTSPKSICVQDVDGDGKADVLITNNNSNTVSVFRNSSTTGLINTVSFSAKVDFPTGAFPFGIACGDIDGDGKADLVTANTNSSSISVFKNTSTSGSITIGSFAAKVDFGTGAGPTSVEIADIDLDGKPDLIVVNSSSNTVSLYRNIGITGVINPTTFSPPVDFPTGSNPDDVVVGDIDDDGKPDLVVTNNLSNTISVLRNTIVSGSIPSASFATKVDFTTGTYPSGIAIGDIDGDGKSDIVAVNYNAATASVFRNTSTSGAITAGSFAAKVDLTTSTNPARVLVGDIDGDGKADIAVTSSSSNVVSVFKNVSTSGVISTGSFNPKVDFSTGTNPWGIALADIDNDGKSDVIAANWGGSTVSVLWNAITAPSVPSAPTNFIATAVSSSQVNLAWTASSTGTPSVYRIYRSLTSGTSYSKLDSVNSLNTTYSNTLLTANTIYWYRVTAVNATGESSASTEDSAKTSTAGLGAPTITSFTPSSGAIGSSVTISGTNFGATQGVSTVMMGGLSATVTFWSSTQIVATVPSLATGGASIAVTTSSGTGNALSLFTVTSATTTYPDPLPGLYKSVLAAGVTTGYVDYVAEENGALWMTGSNGVIAKSLTSPTAGSPVTWTLSNSGIPFSESIYALEFASSTLGFAGSGTGKIYRTTDGGTTWSLTYNNPSATNFINIIKFFNATTGIAAGDGLSSSNTMAYLYTTDGGISWNNNNSYLYGTTTPSRISFPTSTAGYTTGNYNLSAKTYRGLFKTTNNGINWTFYSVGNTSADSVIGSSCIEFRTATVGLVVRNDSTVWKTSNGGTVWTKVGQLPRMGFGITYVNSTIAYVVGNGGMIAQVNYLASTINAALHDPIVFFSRPTYSPTFGALYVPDEDNVKTIYSSMNPSAQLSTPVILSPSNGSPLAATNTQLSWSSVSGTTAYDVEIGSVVSSALKATVYTSSVTSFPVSDLAPGATYQWRVRARSLTNSSAWSALSSFNSPANITLPTVVSAVFPATPKASTDYRLVTIPTGSSMNVSSLLTGTSKDYRMFRDNGNSPPNHLEELDGNSTVNYGEGYWLIKKGSFSFGGSFSFPTPVNGSVSVKTLSSNWAIIGNPFPVAVKWSDVIAANALAVTAKLYQYAGVKGFVESDVMEPYAGYYYFSPFATSLLIPFPFVPTPSPSIPQPAVTMSLVYSSEFNMDQSSFIGIDPSAQTEMDEFDVRKPPVFSDQGSIWFERSQWDGKNKRFAGDVRPAFGDGQTWDFVLQSSADKTARIALQNTEGIPDGFEILFVNKENGMILKPDLHNGVTVQQHEGPSAYSLIIGKKNYLKSQTQSLVPDRFTLSQNYPNPFNPATTVRFGVSSDANVRVTVYDLLGREVERLVDHYLFSGNYEYTFDAKNLASGTYLYSIRVSSAETGYILFSSVKKMMLLK